MSDIQDFNQISSRLLDKGMGTENVAMLLYSLIKLHRPNTTIAVGLGYSTLHILKALAENYLDQHYDQAVLKGLIPDYGRREVLYADYFEEQNEAQIPRLHGIDNFTEKGSHLDSLTECVELLKWEQFLELYKIDYKDFVMGGSETNSADFIWLDCGHQKDYPKLVNKFWPLLSRDGGIMVIHYTYVDLDIEDDNGQTGKHMIAGAFANAVKKQQLLAGIQSRFEVLNFIEPHKFRQGSVTLLRRIDDVDLCRDTDMEEELMILYGSNSEPLIDMNE